MDRTPDFYTLAENAHAASLDRLEAGAEALEEEMRRDMTRALSGLQAHVPGVMWSATTGGREVLTSAADEVIDALDHMECAEALMLVLRGSACPLVAKLRHLVVSRYAHDMADALAPLRNR